MESKIKWKTCAHAPCTCEPRRKSLYCSAYCEASKDKIEETCGCGHAGCGAIGALEDPGALVPETA